MAPDIMGTTHYPLSPDPRRGRHLPSPTPTHATTISVSSDHIAPSVDRSLASAVQFLVQHLVTPLEPYYAVGPLDALRRRITDDLSRIFLPSWDMLHPSWGSGYRSLICDNKGLPRDLARVANDLNIDQTLWLSLLAKGDEGEPIWAWREEWEVWCNPGEVVWRYGPWEYEDGAFEPVNPPREPAKVLWRGRSLLEEVTTNKSLTPARSKAVAIRAPTTVNILPPTPAQPLSEKLDGLSDSFARQAIHHRMPGTLEEEYISPAASERGFSSDGDERVLPREENQPRSLHRGAGSGSTSSTASSSSEPSLTQTQLLTPAFRPGSTDPIPMSPLSQTHDVAEGSIETLKPGLPDSRGHPSSTPLAPTPRDREVSGGSTSSFVSDKSSAANPTPVVTGYDNGNVTVLGGGVKLGASSRPASVMASHRSPIDRSRSPSISLASRALTTAIGPHSSQVPGSPSLGPGGQRKTRTRRRIMPTYLGYVGQPGVGGPVMGAFGQFAPPGRVTWPQGQPGTGVSLGVGLGVAPPPAGLMRPPPGFGRVPS